jgi:hypothetical protein
MHKCTHQYFIILHVGEPFPLYWMWTETHFFIEDSPTVNILNTDHVDAVENVTLKLACQVLDANPTVNSLSWYKGSSTTPIGLLSNFSIRKVTRADSGEYRCEGSNDIGQNGVDTVYVNVLCKYQSYYNSMNVSYVDIL